MKILVTGSNGYIASHLIKKFRQQHDVLGIHRGQADLTSPFETRDIFADNYYDVVINLFRVNYFVFNHSEGISFLLHFY